MKTHVSGNLKKDLTKNKKNKRKFKTPEKQREMAKDKSKGKAWEGVKAEKAAKRDVGYYFFKSLVKLIDYVLSFSFAICF